MREEDFRSINFYLWFFDWLRSSWFFNDLCL